jgi:hypothetical protein
MGSLPPLRFTEGHHCTTLADYIYIDVVHPLLPNPTLNLFDLFPSLWSVSVNHKNTVFYLKCQREYPPIYT